MLSGANFAVFRGGYSIAWWRPNLTPPGSTHWTNRPSLGSRASSWAPGRRDI